MGIFWFSAGGLWPLFDSFSSQPNPARQAAGVKKKQKTRTAQYQLRHQLVRRSSGYPSANLHTRLQDSLMQ